MLSLEHVAAGWGDMQVLNNVSLTIQQGEILAVLGRNGAGKSTLLSSIAGRAKVTAGNITFNRVSLNGMPIFQRARMGIGLVPQSREIFPSLTVAENLRLAFRGGNDTWTEARVFELFPRLRARIHNYGGALSGGEQQMLSIGRALVGNPQILLLDEPMEGLAPVIVEGLLDAIVRIRDKTGLTMIVVEQHPEVALTLTERVLVLDRGEIVYMTARANGAVEREEIKGLLSVAGARSPQ